MGTERFVVREAPRPQWEWLPRWLVIDTLRQVRVGAYDDETFAKEDAAERNLAGGNDQ